MRYLLAEPTSPRVKFRVPSWAFVPDDEIGEIQQQVGNVSCKECKRVSSCWNKACVHCCKHEVLRLMTERLESRALDIEVEVLAVVCEKCGKTYAKDEWEELYGRRIV